ncbi:MAG: triose-phosphate isomerase [Candidatus Ratteibacteria bacterium]|nr:triose-phosphate isomerase [Candidatus Ratteibacteria bacterium]
MRKKIIAGNWKMYKTTREAVQLAENLKKSLVNIKNTIVVLCPPFTSLFSVGQAIKNSTIKLGAQNIYYEKEGAYTGEISPLMIKDVGCQFVIIGHSERRKYFNETDAIINKKIKTALNFGLTPIFCVGETLDQREKGIAESTVISQVEKGLMDMNEEDVLKLVIAYEPVWAIGTGKTATPDVADGMHSVIRKSLSKLYSSDLSNNISILYGGSVKPDNIDALMSQENIDGALVGGASLDSAGFSRIVQFKK